MNEILSFVLKLMKDRFSFLKRANVSDNFGKKTASIVGILPYSVSGMSIRADGNYLTAKLLEATEIIYRGKKRSDSVDTGRINLKPLSLRNYLLQNLIDNVRIILVS